MPGEIWTARWQGHRLTVEYQTDVLAGLASCRLRIDDQVAEEQTTDLAAHWDSLTLHGQVTTTGGQCPYPDCGHTNPPGSRFCARCGRSNEQTHQVRAELTRSVLRIRCRLLVDQIVVLDSG
jgi:hypothetical protein